MVEREKGISLKCLRSDNGGEYMSKEFEPIALSMALDMRRRFLAPCNTMVWLKE